MAEDRGSSDLKSFTTEDTKTDLILCDKCGHFFVFKNFSGHYNVWHTDEKAITEFFRQVSEASRRAAEEYWNSIYESVTPNIGLWF